MKKLSAILICGLLVGCDYSVPLVEIPAIAIDARAIGLWQQQGQTNSLLVLPLGKKEYLVSFPAGSANAMFARASLWRGAGLTLVQLEWLGTARAKTPENGRVFQFAAYSVEGDTMSVRLLNTDVVKKEVQAKDELVRAIAAGRDNPAFFRDALIFTRSRD